ncbi:MAG: hypothetical protein CMF62_03105 [Magnetococcales bacterium]|nr:hypothetical protein [Magnetococcales bacterium]
MDEINEIKYNICDDADWFKMSLDDIETRYNYFCSDKMKETIKSFLTNKILEGYLFTHHLECIDIESEEDFFEFVIAFKKYGEKPQIKRFW